MLETARCIINPFQKTDYAEVKKLFINHEVRKYLGGIRKEDSIQEVLDGMLTKNENSYYWVVRKKQSDSFIGLVSIDPHHEGLYLEISFQFLPNWWGAGYASEVIQLIINYALNELNISKLVAETQTANTSSCRLLERVGMEFEKKINRFGAEQAIYSISKSS